MLVRICRGLPLPYNDCRTKNPELDAENPGRATELGDACVREQTARAWPVKREKWLECQKAPHSWIKNPICPHSDRVYRYTLVVYRYTFATVHF